MLFPVAVAAVSALGSEVGAVEVSLVLLSSCFAPGLWLLPEGER